MGPANSQGLLWSVALFSFIQHFRQYRREKEEEDVYDMLVDTNLNPAGLDEWFFDVFVDYFATVMCPTSWAGTVYFSVVWSI